MNRIFLASTGLALLATRGFAQQPTLIPANLPIRLDGIAAIVSDQVITLNDLRDAIIAKIQRKELEQPKDSAAARAVEHDVLNDMIQEELIIQKAKDLKITVADADVAPQVDRQLRETRAMFKNNEADFRAELQRAALGTPDDFRRYLMEQYRRQMIRDRVMRKLTQDGKIIPINVTDAEISAEFDKAKAFLPPKPASVTFKQIVIAPAPTTAAKGVARVRAESVLAQIKGGADFEKIAKRESMDLETKETGGDLGWIRRGTQLPEFERWLFGTGYQAALQPGQLSPVFETPYGFHIVRIDRVQTGEVKVRQILIAAKIDSLDVERTRKLADSVAGAWRSGTPFDSLAKKYHDYPGREETSILAPGIQRDSLPATYQRGFAEKKAGDIVAFQIAGSAKRPDVPKFVVAQLMTVDEGGERTLPEMREAVRGELAQRGGVRRYIDALKKQTFVLVKLDEVTPADSVKAKPGRASDETVMAGAHRRPRLAITLGDVRGIGPEVVVKAAAARDVRAAADLVFVGPTGAGVEVDEATGAWGADRSAANAGRFAGRAVERAVALALQGEVDGIVTAPLDKGALLAGGYDYPGHTEMLARLTGRRVAMMLAATRPGVGATNPLRVVLATTHIPLRDVVDTLSQRVIVDVATVTRTGLEEWFGIVDPRIALCALNPHAGDGGRFGREDDELLRPAAEAAGIAGPFPADTVFVRAMRGAFDAVIAPYHDVGMTAIKVAAFGSAVNVTLGLPFPRCSPDHGTALDIAGRGIADARSMIEAIVLCAEIAARCSAREPAASQPSG